MNKIGKLQNKAIRLINLHSDVETTMTDEKLLNIQQIIKLELLKFKTGSPI